MVKTLNTPSNSLLNKCHKDKQIFQFLKAVPHLEFSDKGIKNISKRFHVSPEDFKKLIEDYRAEAVRNGK